MLIQSFIHRERRLQNKDKTVLYNKMYLFFITLWPLAKSCNGSSLKSNTEDNDSSPILSKLEGDLYISFCINAERMFRFIDILRLIEKRDSMYAAVGLVE